jgi:hypothetical protein
VGLVGRVSGLAFRGVMTDVFARELTPATAASRFALARNPMGQA